MVEEEAARSWSRFHTEEKTQGTLCFAQREKVKIVVVSKVPSGVADNLWWPKNDEHMSHALELCYHCRGEKVGRKNEL